MIQAVQHAAQIFSSLILASTLGLSLAIGVAGVFHHRFPLDCSACQANVAAPVGRTSSGSNASAKLAMASRL